jgi:hypothetical protein
MWEKLKEAGSCKKNPFLLLFLGAFAKLRKPTAGFVMFARLG